MSISTITQAAPFASYGPPRLAISSTFSLSSRRIYCVGGMVFVQRGNAGFLNEPAYFTNPIDECWLTTGWWTLRRQLLELAWAEASPMLSVIETSPDAADAAVRDYERRLYETLELVPPAPSLWLVLLLTCLDHIRSKRQQGGSPPSMRMLDVGRRWYCRH